MQRTVKLLRIALPIVFVAFVILIVTSWTRRVRSGGEAAVPVTSTQRPDDKAQAEARSFEDTQTIGGRVVSRIRAGRVVAFKSGWNTLEDVQMTIYRANGLTYELVCPRAEFHTETKHADASGGVKVESSDGIMISTPELKFDGNRLTNNVKVQFRIDRWNGNAGAIDLDVAGETLKLLKRVTATMTPVNPIEPPTTLAGDEGLFRRRENDVAFTRKVQMTRGADTVVADNVLGRFTQDRRQMVGLEGNGNVVIVMAQNLQPGENLGGRKTITCDRFFSEVTGDGQINAINTVGETQLAHAILDGPPRRDLVARAFRIGIANKAVSDMKATGDVVMKEIADTTREIRTDLITVNFDAVQHRATTAFVEPFRYADGRSQASAFRANYDIAGDKLVLTADPGFDPTVTTDGNVIKAKRIEFSPRAQTAIATGDVIAQLVPKGGAPSADKSSLFPTGKPVFINADNLNLRQAQKVAYFSGNVKAWQEANTLFANDMEMQGAGSTVTARGGVRTVLYDTGEHRKIPLQARGDQLIARRNERRMEYLGNVHIDDIDRSMDGEKAIFFFDAKQKIERIEAEEKVKFVEKSTSRNASGDKAVYHVNKRMVYFTGSPATATSPQGTIQGQQIAVDLARNRIEIVSPTSPTQGTYKNTGQ